ncbi:MAG: phospho-N-acetylmuramoyl-pentapeptide-transferase [Treponema sp.]|jgi:phospho-N-acetylmuramoyl-pentapeptide-transferase|nr:phospho-N-acetylmuramoyl-pentapeptide-transferase [Treponema sp.]
MLLEFFYPLVTVFTPLNVLQYLTFRGAYAAVTTLLICFILGPKMISALGRLKIGQSIRTDGPATHLIKSGTPTMGGILIIVSVVISMLLWMDFSNSKVWLALGTLVIFGLIGFIDDYLKVSKRNSDGLPAWAKLAAQFLAAIVIMLMLYYFGEEGNTLLYIPFLKNPVIDLGVLWIPFGVLLIVGESNASNFSDGLDGLLAGLLIIVFITMAILCYLSGRADYSSYLGIPYIPGSGELMVYCMAAAGACVAFLWYNSHPAEIFIGDVGSLSLGGLVAVISLIIKKEILVLIIGGVFVLEICSVILQVASFKLRKKRILKMAPLHHHAELSGWAEPKVVTRFWILGGLFAILALSTLKIQ